MSMPPFAFLFPGQGSQTVGMLDAWAGHAAVDRTLEEASDALGSDLVALIAHGPQSQLDLTVHTQPAMLAAAIACWRAWLAEGGAEPAAVAGHSLGEYSALVAAGALRLSDAVRLVRFRAEAMQDAVPAGEGAMAAILGLPADAVVAGCAQASADTGVPVEPANYNDPKQTVISGGTAGVDRACEILKAAGAKRALRLAVSAPFHSSMMQPAAERLRARLVDVEILPPRIAVINNIDVRAESDPAAIRDALVRQAAGPVRWTDTVVALRRDRGIGRYVECGPGKVLAGLVRRIDAEALVVNLHDPASLAASLAATREALAA